MPVHVINSEQTSFQNNSQITQKDQIIEFFWIDNDSMLRNTIFGTDEIKLLAKHLKSLKKKRKNQIK